MLCTKPNHQMISSLMILSLCFCPMLHDRRTHNPGSSGSVALAKVTLLITLEEEIIYLWKYFPLISRQAPRLGFLLVVQQLQQVLLHQPQPHQRVSLFKTHKCLRFTDVLLYTCLIPIIHLNSHGDNNF